MVKKGIRKISTPALIVIASVLVIGASVVIALAFMNQPKRTINNFAECRDAGGAIMESYPEQCVIDSASFTNLDQVPDETGRTDRTEYEGLAEQAALDKAETEDKVARVVERDGEALAITMDFSPGRLNFYVREGFVYKIQVEGEE